MFDAVVFAGGGNRCYWQGGFYEAAAPRLELAPKLVVAASAGAFAAAIRCWAPARKSAKACTTVAARI
jgi:predicted acylesterase/phospholipase RssA